MGEDSQNSTIMLRVKAVPGASRDSIAGMLGDRLKVRVSAPPEGGKANKAITSLLAKTLGIGPTQIRIVSGQSSPEKRFEIDGITREQMGQALGLDITPAIACAGS